MKNQRQLFVAVVFLTGLGIFFAYSKFRKKPILSNPTEFIGIWESPCVKGDRGPNKFTIKFDSKRGFESQHILYFDKNCTDKAMIHRYFGNINFESIGKLDAFKVIYQTTKAEVILLDVKTLAAANKTKLYGLGHWKLASWTPIGIAAKVSYDILKIELGKIFFGDSKSGDQKSVKTRPVKYENFGYSRRSTTTNQSDLVSDAMPDCLGKAESVSSDFGDSKSKYERAYQTFTRSRSSLQNARGKSRARYESEYFKARTEANSAVSTMENIVIVNKEVSKCLKSSCAQEIPKTCYMDNIFTNFRKAAADARRSLR